MSFEWRSRGDIHLRVERCVGVGQIPDWTCATLWIGELPDPPTLDAVARLVPVLARDAVQVFEQSSLVEIASGELEERESALRQHEREMSRLRREADVLRAVIKKNEKAV